MIQLPMSMVYITHTAMMATVVVAVVDVELVAVEVDDVDVVVVVLQTSSDVITMNVTQYCADCTCSLIHRKKNSIII